MAGRPKKAPREKDLTSRFLSGGFEDDDRIEEQESFGDRSKNAQQRKMERTALLRAAEAELAGDLESLPVGQVTQVFSLYFQVEHESGPRLAVARKTLIKLAETLIVVGDRVRFRDTGMIDENGRPEAVIEALLPRQTVLTRTDSFLSHEQHPIVANAEQMLVVASLTNPALKWGLIDRMLIAARGGGLTPIIALNKIDLAEEDAKAAELLDEARAAMAHYSGALGVRTLETSVPRRINIDAVRDLLRDRTTVLAGHSGVGKSTLIAAVQPGLDIRIGDVSHYTAKGRHTTTSARRYPLDFGGHVVDTPGVKLFGLWGVTAENLDEYFPDVEAGTAPQWRKESYARIAASLGE